MSIADKIKLFNTKASPKINTILQSNSPSPNKAKETKKEDNEKEDFSKKLENLQGQMGRMKMSLLSTMPIQMMMPILKEEKEEEKQDDKKKSLFTNRHSFDEVNKTMMQEDIFNKKRIMDNKKKMRKSKFEFSFEDKNDVGINKSKSSFIDNKLILVENEGEEDEVCEEKDQKCECDDN